MDGGPTGILKKGSRTRACGDSLRKSRGKNDTGGRFQKKMKGVRTCRSKLGTKTHVKEMAAKN